MYDLLGPRDGLITNQVMGIFCPVTTITSGHDTHTRRMTHTVHGIAQKLLDVRTHKLCN
jgi:hypothetical protein